MTSLLFFVVHIDKAGLTILLTIIAMLGLLGLWKKQFAAKAKDWPTISAKIESILVDFKRRWRRSGTSEESHVVLAYSYSVNDSYYSGEIKLEADDRSMKEAEELVGQRVDIHYNPEKPSVSIFLKHRVRGWPVMADRRISVLSWLNDLPW